MASSNDEAGDAPQASPADPVYPKPKHLSPEIAASLRSYWRSNVKLMIGLLVIWAVVGLGCGVLFADKLNAYHLGGYPLGFWFAQQGSIICFVFIILIYARRLNRLDRKHHDEIEALKKKAGAGGES